MLSFAVLGAGRWGGTLAWLTSHEIGVPVRLYDRTEVLRYIRCTRRQGDSDLSGLMVLLSDKLGWVLECDVVFVVINATHLGDLIADIKAQRINMAGKLVVLCMKGMSPEGLFMPEQWAAAFPESQVAVMGGPCQPAQLFAGKSTTMCIATNKGYSRMISADDICQTMNNRLINYEPTESIMGAAICGVMKNVLAFVGGMLDAYGWSHKKPLLELIFREEASRLIKAFDEDCDIVDGPLFSGDNKVTLYYPGSKNIISGRTLIEQGFLTPCEAVDSAMPLAIRISQLGFPMGMCGWTATMIARAPQCRTPTKAALRSRLRYYQKQYQIE
ncbi:MAG: hypothetical protein LBL84_03330 [Candidatus Nomurabacteria bacterium]|jgi:glycerol-3-phosphate dehydrogenase|nr:hypothetical protein [Candidatus Nomurabacteria bacterium]